MVDFKRTMLTMGLAALAAIVAEAAGAQGDSAANFPNRPIHLIVGFAAGGGNDLFARLVGRSEEHTSELQSHVNLVCRLLLEKKKKKETTNYTYQYTTKFSET